MKILLVALNAKYVHSNLAVHNLQAYAKRKMYSSWNKEGMNEKEEVANLEHMRNLPEIIVREYTINHNLDSVLQSIYMEKAAVVAFSCYIWNVHEILTIARELYKISPETQIWLGGPEVSYHSAELLQEHTFVEGIIRGEGEVTFMELVKCWHRFYTFDTLDERIAFDYAEVKGITYRSHEGLVVTNAEHPLMSMDEVPFIYEDLKEFDNKILYYESSRGCPFSCSYCLSSIDKSVRFRNMELVEKELQFFLDHKVPQVKFIDRTFNCNREHALAVWRYIAEHDNGVTNFHFEVSADLLGEEELALFEKMRMGLIQLEIGLQSTNPKTIQEIHRSMNIKRLKENMCKIRSFQNIHQHLDLIAGLPFEDFVTFKKSFDDAYAMKPNQLQLGFLKVLKGSYMEEQIAEYELKYQDFQPYEVLSTKWLSYEEKVQLKAVEEMVEVYYNSDQFEHVLPYVISFFESPYAFYEALGAYYQTHDLFGIGFKREARYEVLAQFCAKWFGKSDKIASGVGDTKNEDLAEHFHSKLFISLLTFDYYLREKAKSRPSWLPSEPIGKTEYHAFFKNGGTEEVCLDDGEYDSKIAARAMHIEPVVQEAVSWIVGEDENTIAQWGSLSQKFVANSREIYCLFDYNNRNPLTKAAKVMLLSHL